MRLLDAIRTLLKIRRRRTAPRASAKPALGAKIAMEDFRIVVQAGLSDELWIFLVQAGFREVIHRPDCRRYRDVPPSMVTELCQAPPEEWQALLLAALKEAVKRPRVRVGPRSARRP